MKPNSATRLWPLLSFASTTKTKETVTMNRIIANQINAGTGLFRRVQRCACIIWTAVFLGSVMPAPQLFAATTGFNKTSGNNDLAATGNWVGGVINGIWDSSLTLTGNLTNTIDTNTIGGVTVYPLASGLTFNYAGNYNVTLRSAFGQTNTLKLGGDVIVNTSGGTSAYVYFGGNSLPPFSLDLGGATRTFNIASNRKLIINNNVTQNPTLTNGAIVKTGSGALELYHVNGTYAGGLTISNGIVRIQSYQTGTGRNGLGLGGVTVVSDGTTTTGGQLNLSGYGNGAALMVTNPITIVGVGEGASKNPAILTGGGNETNSSTSLITLSGAGTYRLSQNPGTTGPANLWNIQGAIARSGANVGTLVFEADSYYNAGATTNNPILLNGTISNNGGPLLLTSTGATGSYGTLQMNASGNAIGDTTITGTFNDPVIQATILRLGISNPLSQTNNLTITAGELDLASFNQTVNGLSGAASLVLITNSSTTTSTLTVSNANGDPGGYIYAGSINDNPSGKIAIVKAGPGTQTFSGVNSYAGTTTITGGKLVGLAGGSFAGSAVTVQAASGTATLAAANVSGNGSGQWTCASLTTAAGGTGPVLEIDLNEVPSVAPLNVTGTLAFSVTPTVKVGVSASLSPSTSYPLITVGGTAPTAVPSLVMGGRNSYPGAYLSWIGNTLYLNVASVSSSLALPLHWAGSGTGLWNSGDGGNLIWNDNNVTPLSTFYLDGDQVAFDEKYINANQTLALNSTVYPASVLVSNATYNYTITGTGSISGTNSLTKTGNATLVLQPGVNTTGAVTINGGTVQVASSTGITAGGLTGSGGTLDLTKNIITLNLNSGQTNSYSGAIAGYFPASAGTIGTGGFGLKIPSSGVLLLNGGISLAADPGTFTSPSRCRINPAGTSEIDFSGTTLLTNVAIYPTDNAIARFTGGTHFLTGTNGNFTLNIQSSGQIIVDNGTVNTPWVNIGFGATGNASLTINGGALTVYPGLTNSCITIGGNISSGTSSLNLNGGVLTVPKISDADSGITISGNNVINFNGGKLVCASTNVIPRDGGYNGADPISLLVGDGGAVIDTAGYDNTIVLGLQTNGTGGLTKLGAGTLTLTNVNTYGGPTIVKGGSLALTGSATLASSLISVTNGATFDVSGLASFVLGSGQTLSNSAASTGALKGNINANAGALAASFINGTPVFTLANGTLTLSAGTSVKVNNIGPSLGGGTYPLVVAGTGGSVAGTVPSVSVTGGGLSAGATAALNINGSGGLDLVVTGGTPNPTNITYTFSGTTMTLNWPTNQGWLLQSNSIGLVNTGAWQTVTGATPPYPITISPNQTNVFYRLKY